MINAGYALIDLETDEVISTWPDLPGRIEIPDVLRVDGANVGWVSTDKQYKLALLVANDPPEGPYRITNEELSVQYATVKAKRAVATREYETIVVANIDQEKKDRLAEIDAIQTVDDIKAIMRRDLVGTAPVAVSRSKKTTKRKRV